MLKTRVLAAAVLGLTLVASPATAAGTSTIFDQEGKRTSVTNVSGTTVAITPGAITPSYGQCVIYATLVYDDTAKLQVETGVTKCYRARLDECPADSSYAFTETFSNATSYHCSVGGSFPLNAATTALIQRTSGTTEMWGSTLGSYRSMSGFLSGDIIIALTWAEASGVYSCPTAPHAASFANWQKFQNSTGWSHVSVDLNHSAQMGMTGMAPCWSIGALGGNGSFNVQ